MIRFVLGLVDLGLTVGGAVLIWHLQHGKTVDGIVCAVFQRLR